MARMSQTAHYLWQRINTSPEGWVMDAYGGDTSEEEAGVIADYLFSLDLLRRSGSAGEIVEVAQMTDDEFYKHCFDALTPAETGALP